SGPVWGDCSAGIGESANLWNIASGTIQPKNLGVDLLIGGAATSSAKFAVINVLSGTPTASVSGSTGTISLIANGTLATTNKQSLILGDENTGNIILGNGSFTSAGILHSSTTGVLSTAPVALGSEVSGILAAANGGTGADLSAAETGALPYFSDTGVMSGLPIGLDGQLLSVQGGLPSWISASTVNYWQQASGAIAPLDITNDLLLGSTATSSAKFAFMNIAGSLTPVASISATSGSNSGLGVSLKGDGSIQSLRNGTLTIGGNTTGNIIISPQNGAITGLVSVNGTIDLASGFAYKINGQSVLSTNTLGSGVTSSSLTGVGTLTSGIWQATAIGTQYGGTGQNFIGVNQGAIPYFSGTGVMSTLAAGSAGYVLSTNGTNQNPSWI
ncbi:MAG TPA: hypothetical protein V6C65_00660, partial [Allocoleopsis sp.]